MGLGYLRLGQSATTLSGGEAQRVKLAAHLAQASCEGTLFLFDEPTTGLHFDDISKLLLAFEKLIANGGSILVIEHNLDLIQAADWIIDLGPEGGEAGGRIVAQGTPETIAQTRNRIRANISKWRWRNVQSLKQLPSVDQVLQKLGDADGWPHDVVVGEIRAVLDEQRPKSRPVAALESNIEELFVDDCVHLPTVFTARD